jgi:putative ABC transport system permease protein
MDGVRQDVRQALRAMAQHKGFTAAALVSLALGIGANAALFSVVYGVLLRPLPYPESGRLVRLWEEHPGATAAFHGRLLTNFTFDAWRPAPRTVEGLAAFSQGEYTETSGPQAVRVTGAAVSPELFALLGVPPAAGRFLLPDDAVPGAAPVVVLSDAFFRQRFGGDPAALGGTLTLDGKPATIVGVMPPGFYFPGRDARLWTPYAVAPAVAQADRQSISLFGAVARLTPGSTPAQAAAEGTAAARSVARPPIAEAIFGKGGPVAVRVETLVDDMTAGVRPALLVLAVGVGFLLLICCANVANLLLSRGVSRRRELAVRAAMGAGGRRLARQLLTESLTLGALGGALGLGLGWALLRLLPALAPADFPRLDDVRLDGPTLAFAALAALGAGLLSGVLPALRAAGRGLFGALREGTGASAGARTMRLGTGLLVVEAALAVVLLVAAGLLGRSFSRLLAVDPGYDPGNVLLAQLDLGDEGGAERMQALIEPLLDRLRSTSGVAAAGAGNMAPLARSTAIFQFELPEPGPGGEKVKARAVSYSVTPGYAEALSLRLRQGRLLAAGDRDSGTRALVVNEEFVRSYLADGKPVVGRRWPALFGDDGEPTEIVGVVGDVLKDGLDTQPQNEIYALWQDRAASSSEAYVAVRTAGDPLAVAPALRALVGELEPTATVEVATLASRVSASVAQPRFAAAALAAFALLALTLAAAGLYGVLSYSVTRRQREMGVRSALGAGPGDIVRLVLRQGLGVTAAGLVLGLAAAAATTRLLGSLLFGVTPLDAAAFAAAPLLLLAVALVACLVPARRAAAVDPTEALRSE